MIPAKVKEAEEATPEEASPDTEKEGDKSEDTEKESKKEKKWVVTRFFIGLNLIYFIYQENWEAWRRVVHSKRIAVAGKENLRCWEVERREVGGTGKAAPLRDAKTNGFTH